MLTTDYEHEEKTEDLDGGNKYDLQRKRQNERLSGV